MSDPEIDDDEIDTPPRPYRAPTSWMSGVGYVVAIVGLLALVAGGPFMAAGGFVLVSGVVLLVGGAIVAEMRAQYLGV